jgi:hypothetical protein
VGIPGEARGNRWKNVFGENSRKELNVLVGIPVPYRIVRHECREDRGLHFCCAKAAAEALICEAVGCCRKNSISSHFHQRQVILESLQLMR